MMPHVKSFEFLNRISLSRKHASILFYKQQAGELSVLGLKSQSIDNV